MKARLSLAIVKAMIAAAAVVLARPKVRPSLSRWPNQHRRQNHPSGGGGSQILWEKEDGGGARAGAGRRW